MKPRSASKSRRKRQFPPGYVRQSLLLILGAVVLGVGLYALAGAYGVPWLVDRWLAQYPASAPGRTLSREAVRFNPFTLVGEIDALEALDAQTGTAFVARRLVVDFAAQSLIERRPVVSSIVVERPGIDFASVADLTALARRAYSTVPDRTRVERVELAGGTLSIGAEGDRAVAFSRFELALTGFDELSGEAGDFSLEAETAAGASITIDGSLATTLERADGLLSLSGMDLAAFASRLGGLFRNIEPRGRVDLSAEFTARSLLSLPALELSGADLTFSDLSLTPPTGPTVTADRVTAAASLTLTANEDGLDVGGRIEADDARLSMRDTRATPPQSFTFDGAALVTNSGNDGLSLILGGRLIEAGEAALTVRVPPGDAARRVSIEAADLPATLLSGYTADALGRRLADGSADLRLVYSLSGDRADGSLHITARDLAFARNAAGQNAVAGRPSLELAAALLEDADGIIDVDLRFASNTGTVRDALADALMARIGTVTATPFDTLAALADGTAEPTSAVPFLPGDAALNDRALAAVAALANVLNARPRLGVRVYGGYDATADRDALARQQIELHVQLATADPNARARPVPVDFGSPRAQDVLDEFAGERLPAERVAELAGRFDCEGALAEVCKRSYYEQIFDALVANEEIGPSTLSRLGRFRAQSVIDALRERHIATERIELVPSSNVAETDFGIGLAVELTALDSAP